ncbi:hypothetical protein glysoja_048202 [Glycine soja]|uniref:DUF223 domain-containing protein n=1 Tax=Glycine soja TaxID=3848 RepID=A0A0B2Q8J7_GLYSO|nr:hypothetical protein glysoja_048202 [Glycine soja]
MSRKENLISELHMRKGTWKIVVRITDLWEVRKQNSKQAIEMVLMDQTDCYCLTFGTIDEIIIDAPWSYDNCPYCTTTFDPSKVGSACRSCQNQVNNTVPSIMGTKETSFSGMQHVSRCLGDDIKVFPPCVDEILSKTWAIRFKYRSQLRQSSVLDVSEEPHHIQTLTTILGLKVITN